MKKSIKKLHVLDYVIIGCVIIIISLFLYLRLNRKTQWITVLVKIQPEQLWWEANPAPWYTQSISKNQESYNSFGQKIAIVNHVQSFETATGKNNVMVEVNLKTSYDSSRRQYEYNYQPILVGKPLIVPFSNFSLTGMIIGINTQLTFVEKNIEARILAVHPWKIADLAKGSQAKDAAGNVIAEIIDMTIQNAQAYRFNDLYGRQVITQAEDPTRKDVILKLKIKTIQYNGIFYSIDGAPIKIGASFNLQFPSTSLNFIEISAVYD